MYFLTKSRVLDNCIGMHFLSSRSIRLYFFRSSLAIREDRFFFFFLSHKHKKLKNLRKFPPEGQKGRNHRMQKSKAHNALSPINVGARPWQWHREGWPSLDPAYEGPGSCRTSESVGCSTSRPHLTRPLRQLSCGPVASVILQQPSHCKLNIYISIGEPTPTNYVSFYILQ
jgi:hypothetical protein